MDTLNRYQGADHFASNPRINDVDVFAFTEDSTAVYINYMRVIRGAIIQTYTLEIKQRIERRDKRANVSGYHRVKA